MSNGRFWLLMAALIAGLWLAGRLVTNEYVFFAGYAVLQYILLATAWNLLGGMGNAGDGIKIGIIDTGVEAANPAFQDPTLPLPPGYPFCTPGDCQFTNNKVIVARSYVRLLTTGNPASSTPDDYSARDRVGHGTAAASCAAANVTTSRSITFSGMASPAFK